MLVKLTVFQEMCLVCHKKNKTSSTNMTVQFSLKLYNSSGETNKKDVVPLSGEAIMYAMRFNVVNYPMHSWTKSFHNPKWVFPYYGFEIQMEM